MKRSPMKRSVTPTGPDFETVLKVLERDSHACVLCLTPVRGDRGRDWSIHHRQPRGMGGGGPASNSPSNLVTLCGAANDGCHGLTESRRAEALRSGLLVSRYSDPANVALLLYGRRWVYLTADATYADNPPERMEAAP